jgi:aminoglycoside phosphotransferase (APT) family kinase protein
MAGPSQETVEVEERLRFDEARLAQYLVGQGLPGLDSALEVRKFGYGASNPTYFLHAGGHRYVLRKKPPGKLIKGAHAVEREFKVMSALGRAGFTVPVMHVLCEDDSVIGTPFYVMSFVQGRIADNALSTLAVSHRQPAMLAIVEALAKLHSYDPASLGLLEGGKGKAFGQLGGFYSRQMKTLSRTSEMQVASSRGEVAALRSMPALLAKMAANMPEDRSCVIHGDWKPDNIVLGGDPACPRVLAALDWELSTIGHPMSDLANMCLPYHLGRLGELVTYGPFDLSEGSGVPSEEDVHRAYCSRAGIPYPIRDWGFFVAFSCFRLAVIAQGVAMRAASGQGSQKSGSSSIEFMGSAANALCDMGLKTMMDAYPSEAKL